ncbi:MAG: murein L,D-transpeptidase catalytic domain family protein [Thermoanaerobaculia bacterium]|nr:murein L,D-transpeptidase catalytic domain family protein [Thermoanaerobaculia bacterium]
MKGFGKDILVAVFLLGVLATFSASNAAAEVPSLDQLAELAPTLDRGVLGLALDAYTCAESRDEIKSPGILTVIDYSLPSTKPRFWVFDLDTPSLLYKELVAHGKGTGENFAKKFSNRQGSKQTSLGLFVTAGTYYGRNGKSLYLHGLEKGVNDAAYDRTIVMHGAWYVSNKFVRQHGRLGRSWGCPALRKEVASDVIDTIRDGSAVFAYYPDQNWLAKSEFLSCSDSGNRSVRSR